MLGNNLCRNQSNLNFSVITCTVPPSSSLSTAQVDVRVSDGLNSTTAVRQFLYNMTNTPTIQSIYPNFVTMTGGLLSINGSGFGTHGVSVLVNMSRIRVLTLSDNNILANLSALPPGRYPVTVLTQLGYARPLFHIEYRFYVQQVSPQIGSAYGGADIYVQGAGFENGTHVQLRDQLNNLTPCDIISMHPSQIHCRTTSTTRQATITSNGVHPTYGFGYAWFPAYRTIQQGTNVTWSWSSAQLLVPVYYKIQQVASAYVEESLPNGFDSGLATVSGKCEICSADHTDSGVDCPRFFFLSIRHIGYVLLLVPQRQSVRRVRDSRCHRSGSVRSRDHERGNRLGSVHWWALVTVLWSRLVLLVSATAQTCAFPFTFDSVAYNACTSVNDTQLWCSPTPNYDGQRLYCTPSGKSPAEVRILLVQKVVRRIHRLLLKKVKCSECM